MQIQDILALPCASQLFNIALDYIKSDSSVVHQAVQSKLFEKISLKSAEDNLGDFIDSLETFLKQDSQHVRFCADQLLAIGRQAARRESQEAKDVLKKATLRLAELAFVKSIDGLDVSTTLQKFICQHVLILLQDGIQQSEDDVLFTALLDRISSISQSDRISLIDQHAFDLSLKLRRFEQDDRIPQWVNSNQFHCFYAVSRPSGT